MYAALIELLGHVRDVAKKKFKNHQSLENHCTSVYKKLKKDTPPRISVSDT